MNLVNELAELKRFIEKELDNTLTIKDSPERIIYEAMKYSLLAGGKRLRPILNIKACELVNGNINDTLPFALAIEMIHTYSLIHDDLPAMDNDDYRRGKLTNHKVFGEAISILAGDGLLNLAYEIMIDNISQKEEDSEKFIEAFKEIAKSAGVYGMVGGQVVDILSENKEIDETILNYIHNNKTSALIEASLVSGAIVGGGSKVEIERIRNFGKAIGLCFQIRDDILDCIGDKDKLGKNIGSDITSNKYTFINHFGLNKSINKTKELCLEAIGYLDIFDYEKTEFLINLAKYLVYREK